MCRDRCCVFSVICGRMYGVRFATIPDFVGDYIMSVLGEYIYCCNVLKFGVRVCVFFMYG